MLTHIYYRWRKILLSASILLILPMSIVSENKSQDVLVYTVANDDGSKTPFMLYDPQTRVSTAIHPNSEDGVFLRSFSLSADGHLAFSSEEEGHTDIYVKDVLSPDLTPINITRNTTANEYPRDWSPDGRYLAFTSTNAETNKQVYVWNGETTVNITPEHMDFTPSVFDEFSWSLDGRLAFTAFGGLAYGPGYEEHDPSEIFLWDGKATTDLSQNPTGEDRGPIWNAKGQLAFESARDNDYDILIWDGVSLKSGSQDSDTFINVSPELTNRGVPTWTNDNLLAFHATAPQEWLQIYKWDGKTATNISQNPDQENVAAVWSDDGRWAFSTHQLSLYVKDAENHTLLKVEGQYLPAWSQSGYLIFCTHSYDEDEPAWTLSLWDGQEIMKVAQGREIRAQWNGGSGVYCSSG